MILTKKQKIIGVSLAVVLALPIAKVIMPNKYLDTTVQAATYGTVTASKLNVRDRAQVNHSNVIGTLSKGQEVQIVSNVYSNGDPWYKINYNGKQGYVSQKYIGNKTNKYDYGGYKTSNMKVATSNLNVRSGPGTNYKKIGMFKKNQAFTVVSSHNGWYKVDTSAGIGYVSAQYTR